MGKARGRGSERSRSFLLFLCKTLYRFRSFSLPFRLVWEGACSFLSLLSSQKGGYLSPSKNVHCLSVFFSFCGKSPFPSFSLRGGYKKQKQRKQKKARASEEETSKASVQQEEEGRKQIIRRRLLNEKKCALEAKKKKKLSLSARQSCQTPYTTPAPPLRRPQAPRRGFAAPRARRLSPPRR